MSNPKGIITRKDIIEDEALKWGAVYSENIKEAVKQNNILVDSVKELNKQVQAFKGANSQKDYITAKQAEALATQQAIDAIKKQEAAEISADKVKRSAIATMEAERKAKQAAIDSTNKAQKAKESSVKLTIEERVQNEINNKVLKQEALERLGLVSAYTKLNASRTEAKNKLRDLIASESASTDQIKKAQKEYETLDTKVRKADQAVGDFSKNVGNYPLKGLANGLKDLIGAFGIAGGIGAFAGIIKNAYQTNKQFEQGLADLSAITGATGKDLEYLKKQSIDLGKSTKGGAIEVVEAYKLIASAKPELLTNVTALNEVTEATIRLAQASGLQIPEAATKLTDAMNQFNAPASEAAKYVDVLAAGAKYGAAEIPQLTDAILEFGAVAKTSNVDIKESTALVELLAEKGQKGAEAGTKIRNILLQVMSGGNTAEARKELDKYGISIENLKDKSIPFADKLESLKPLLKDVSSVTQVFGKENATAAISLIENTKRLKELTIQVNENGVASEQAAIKMDTLQGKTDILGSTYDSLIISIGSGSGVVSGFFKFFVDGATESLKFLSKINETWDQTFERSKSEGSLAGAAMFNKSFQSTYKGLSEKEKKEIQNRIDDIDKEILTQTNQKQAELRGEREGLFEKLALSDPKAVKASIKKISKDAYNEYAKEYNELQKKTLDLAKNLKGDDFTFFVKKGYNPTRKAELIKLMQQEQEQINIANAEVKAKNKSGNVDQASGVTDIDPKEIQKRKDYQKKMADSDYELKKQRLEQTIKFNNEITSEETQSDEIRIQSALNSQQKQFELLLLTKNHLLDQEKLTAKDRIRIEEDFADKKIEVSKKIALEIDKIKQFDEAKYIKDLEDKISKQNIALNSELEAENKKFLALGDLEKLNQKDRESAIENHEKAIFDIKKRYAIEALKLQISNLETELIASDALPVKEQLSAEKRQKIAETLSKAKLELSEVEINNNDKKNSKTVDNEKITATKILEISQSLTSALGQLSDAIYGSKIANIDAEISANDEFYAKQIELAGNDQRKKDILQKEAEEKRKKLEAEKRKEQHKQAVLNKAVSAVQIGISTSLAIMQAYAQLGPIVGTPGAILAGVLGAIQLAAVLATPIPKYKDGRTDGPAELAIVGDGGRNEIIARASGIIQMTPATDTLVKLEQGDKVYSSVDEYYKLQRAAMFASIDLQGKEATAFQASQSFENAYSKEYLTELKEVNKNLKKQKTSVSVNVPKLDFAHEFWKMKNRNWN